ncbi:hypothetical protein [Polluticoccus soli]|uniref:hypothetical protein n=1 Tax=Polluticoccus soli TaxID=3034150 RepID=UPI0023E13FE4|nr:hypothetical protein [Flavipsychrobacter sp. JY13-12]
MTAVEFEERLKRRTRFERYYYYLLCLAITGTSFYILWQIRTRPQFLNRWLAMGTFCFFLGIYGLFKLSNRYKIISVASDKSLPQKKVIIERLLSELSIQVVPDENYYSFTHRRKWWGSPFDVHLFYDEQIVSFSIQGKDYSDGGFLDLGETERLRKKIAKKLKEHLEAA